MLIPASHLIGTPILSMHAAAQIARIVGCVVDPGTLKILAFTVAGALPDRRANLLPVQSVREYSQYGMVVDSADEFVAPDDIVRLSEILKLNFNPVGLKVETKKGSKLGRVSDFTVTSDDFTLQQIIVKRPAFKAILDPELTIPRTEIVEVTDYKIIVKDEEKVIKARAMNEDFIPNFVNPFRKSSPAPAPNHMQNPDDTNKP